MAETRTHELKTWPTFFEAVRSGTKRFEIRRNDRDFGVGDILLLDEWDPGKNAPFEYTHRRLRCVVTYVMPGGRFGLSEHFVALGISAPLEERKP